MENFTIIGVRKSLSKVYRKVLSCKFIIDHKITDQL